MDTTSVTLDIVNMVPVVTAIGEIDVSTVPMLLARFEELSAQSTRVVIDFSGVTFLDSSGLGALVACQKRLENPAARVDIVASSPHLLKLLSITGLDELFHVHATREAALAAE